MKATEHPVFEDLRFFTQIIENEESHPIEVETATIHREMLIKKLRLN